MATQKNTTQAIAVAEKGKDWTEDYVTQVYFQQIIDLLEPTDAREEKLEPSEKRKRRAAKE